MDDRPRPSRSGQNSAYRPSRWRASSAADRGSGVASVGVGSEDSLVGARGADRSRSLDVAQRHGRASVGEHARDLVAGRLVGRGRSGGNAAERAATQRLTADDGQLVRGSAKRTRHERHGGDRTDRGAAEQLASSTSQNRARAYRRGRSAPVRWLTSRPWISIYGERRGWTRRRPRSLPRRRGWVWRRR